MVVRIITVALMLAVIYMGFRQGSGMLMARPDSVSLFENLGFTPIARQAFGLLTIGSAVLIIFPQFYTLGNILMGGSIFVILCLELSIKDLQRAALEVPFLLLNLLLLYFQYPLPKQK